MRREADVNEAAAVPAEPALGAIDFAALGRALWRRRRWIVIPTIAVAVLSFVVVNVLTPRYRSEARVLIENRETAYQRPEVDRGTGERDRPLLDAEAVQSQVQLALSRDLARQVVRDLKLAERPEFNPDASASFFGKWMSLVGLARDPSRLTVEERVLERYYERLSVSQVERSRVIAIEFRSEDAGLAAQVANAVADGYLALQLQAKQQAMRQAGQWLAREIEQLRTRVAEAEGRVEAFRGKSNLYVGSNNNPLSAQQLAEQNSQLVLARSQRADAESKARTIRELLRSGRPIEASDITNSELIRRLNEQRAVLKAQLAEQSSTLLPLHPRIKELRAQIADLEVQIRAEAEKLVRSFENDARIAGARVETLSANLDQSKRQASALGADDVQLRALEREAKAQRDLLESYLARYRDVTARETPEAVSPDARIVSRAVQSPTPYFPKKLPIVLLATLAAAICMAAFFTVGELMAGSPGLAAGAAVVRPLPDAVESAAPQSWISTREAPPRRSDPAGGEPAGALSALSRHVRGLGRGIVAVSPAIGHEPAPQLAVELARDLAQQGARILLLDLDVAAAPAAQLVSDARAPGLADLLFGVATFGEVIQRDRASRIHVIATGRGVRDTASLLSAERLAIVFGAVSQTYDQVIVAAPALAALQGAERLARFARGVVLVAAEGEEGAAAAASDTVGARGFANLVVVTLADDGPAGRAPVPGRAAA